MSHNSKLLENRTGRRRTVKIIKIIAAAGGISVGIALLLLAIMTVSVAIGPLMLAELHSADDDTPVQRRQPIHAKTVTTTKTARKL